MLSRDGSVHETHIFFWLYVRESSLEVVIETKTTFFSFSFIYIYIYYAYVRLYTGTCVVRFTVCVCVCVSLGWKRDTVYSDKDLFMWDCYLHSWSKCTVIFWQMSLGQQTYSLIFLQLIHTVWLHIWIINFLYYLI
jgi:hypothetical protein